MRDNFAYLQFISSFQQENGAQSRRLDITVAVHSCVLYLHVYGPLLYLST